MRHRSCASLRFAVTFAVVAQLVTGIGGAPLSTQPDAAAPRLNRLIDSLEHGRPALGTVNRQAPRSLDAARALAVQEFDFAVFDVEAGATDLPQFEASLRALRDPAVLGPSRRPISPIVRIPKESNRSPETVVPMFLDVGAFGIMFGHIDTPADAERAVAAIRGRRAGAPQSLGAARYWGLTERAYAARANVWPLDRRGELVAIMMIESPEAVKNAREIAQVPGVTALFFGPGDFSRAINTAARLPDIAPEAELAVQTMLTACRAANVACGYPAAARTRDALQAEATKRLSQGFQVVTQVNLQAF